MICHKRILCVVVGMMLFTSSNLLLADSKEIDLRSIGSTVTKIEYSYEDDSWHDVDMDTLQIELPNLEEETTLLLNLSRGSEQSITSTKPIFLDLRALGEGTDRIEYSYEDNPWRDVDMDTMEIQLPYSEEDETIVLISLYRGSMAPIEEETEPSKEGMEVTLSPYATAMLTDTNLRHMYTLPFGLGLDVSFTFPFCRNLIFKADTEVKFAISNNIWAEYFILFGGDVGLGYRFNLPAGFMLTPSLSYGLYLHHGLKSDLGQPLFLTHHAGLDVEVGFQTNSNMHLFVAPHVQMMIDKTRNGFLYGLRAGVGFTL